MSVHVAQKGILKPRKIARPTLIGKTIREAIAAHKFKEKKVTFNRSVRADEVSKGPKVWPPLAVGIKTICTFFYEFYFSRSEPTHDVVLAMLTKALEQALQFQKMIATEAKTKASTGSSGSVPDDEALLEYLLSKREHQKVLATLRSAQLQALKKQKPNATKKIRKPPTISSKTAPDDEELLEYLESKREHHKVIAALNKFLLQALRQRKPKAITNPSMSFSEDDELIEILESGHQEVIVELDMRLLQALGQQKLEAIPNQSLSSPEGEEFFNFLESGHQQVIDELDKRLLQALKLRDLEAIENPSPRSSEDEELLKLLESGHQDIIDELDKRVVQALKLQKQKAADKSLLGLMGISIEDEEVPAAQRQIKVNLKVEDFKSECVGRMCKQYSELRALKGFEYNEDKRLAKIKFLDKIESDLLIHFEMIRMAVGKGKYRSYKYDEDEKQSFIETIRNYFLIDPDLESCRSDLSELMRKLPLPTEKIEQSMQEKPPSPARPTSARLAESPKRLRNVQPRLVRSASPQRNRLARSRLNKSMPSASKHGRGWLHQLQNPQPAEKIQEKVFQGLEQLQIMKSREENSKAIKEKLRHLTKRFCAIYAANHNTTRLAGFEVWSKAFLDNINPLLDDLEAYYKDLPHAASKIFNREQVSFHLHSLLAALYSDTSEMTMSETDCEEIVSNRIAASAELAQLKKLQDILRDFVQQMQELLEPLVPSDDKGRKQLEVELVAATSLSKVPSITIRRRPLIRPSTRVSSPRTSPTFNRPFDITPKYLKAVSEQNETTVYKPTRLDFVKKMTIMDLVEKLSNLKERVQRAVSPTSFEFDDRNNVPYSHTIVNEEVIAQKRLRQKEVERLEGVTARDQPSQSEAEANHPVTQQSTQSYNRPYSRMYSIIADTSFERCDKDESSVHQKRRPRSSEVKRIKDQIQPYFIWN